MYVDRVSLANERALLHYQVRPYGGSLRCAIAAQRGFSGEDTRKRWRALAPHDYAQIELPVADSGLMLMPACAPALARWMQEVLDGAERVSSGSAGAGPQGV